MLTVKTNRTDNVGSIHTQGLEDGVDGAVEGRLELAAAEVGLDALGLGEVLGQGVAQGDEGEGGEDGELHFVVLVCCLREECIEELNGLNGLGERIPMRMSTWQRQLYNIPVDRDELWDDIGHLLLST